MNSLSSTYRSAILTSFGPQLLSLDLGKCFDFDFIDELKPCTQLRELEKGESTFQPISIENNNANAMIFQSRKKISIHKCVELKDFLGMTMPSLTELVLNCAHYGISSASDWKWKDLPRLYPRLKELTIRQPCKSLTLDRVRLIANQLPHLKRITLPKEMLQSDEQKMLSEKLVVELKQLLSRSVFLYFNDPKPILETNCYYNSLTVD